MLDHEGTADAGTKLRYLTSPGGDSSIGFVPDVGMLDIWVFVVVIKDFAFSMLLLSERILNTVK